MQVLEDKVREYAAEINDLAEKLESKGEEVERLGREVTKLVMMSAAASARVASLEHELAEAGLGNQDLQAKLDDANRLKRRYQHAITKWQAKVAALKDERSTLQAERSVA